MASFPLLLAMRLFLGNSGILPADRQTIWNPGLNPIGGIPNRTTIFTTLSPLGSGQSDATQIQNAVDACPVGQVVALTAGTFIIPGTVAFSFTRITKGITLRGAGAGVTILQKTNGSTNNDFHPGPNQSPVVQIGTKEDPTVTTNLTADAAKGASSVTVASATGLLAGDLVALTELSGASFVTDPQGRGQIWAAPDFRIVWQKHNPFDSNDDFAAGVFPADAGSAGTFWCYPDRPTGEIKKIASVAGSVVTFTTPVHISYRIANTAQLAKSPTVVVNAGVENLTLTGGDNGNIVFGQCERCWMKNVESKSWLNEGVNIIQCFGTEIRDSYLHDTVWPVPGGGGYAFSQAFYSAETLVENCISVRVNKVMVSRCAGAASVFGYNYADMGYINGQESWIEIGLNQSHMTGPHHVLFEGNYSFNADSDKTHGNAIYHTYFRNHLRGIRATFTDIDGTVINDAAGFATNGPARCGGATAYSYWMSFVGNVMGASGQMSGWVYESTFASGVPGIWLLGWDDFSPYPVDPTVKTTMIRDGNWDWLTSSQQWHNTPATFTIPNSLYLSAKPAFFGANAWPWVNPATGATSALPAKVRFDAGTPNVVP